MNVQGDIWRERWFTTGGYHGSRKPVGLMMHGIEGQHDPRDLVNPCLRGRTFEEASAEHVIKRPMAPLVDSVALGMVGGSENPLYPQGAQQLCPDVTYELTSTVGKEPARGAGVWDHVAKEGFAYRVRGILVEGTRMVNYRVAIHEHYEEFLAVIGWQRSHNVDGQRVPGTLRLDGASRLLTMVIIAAQLALWTTLCYFEANAVAGFVGISIVEELPQRLPSEVGSGVELSCEFLGFVLILYEADQEENVFWWRRVNWQPAEAINVGLCLPRSMFD